MLKQPTQSWTWFAVRFVLLERVSGIGLVGVVWYWLLTLSELSVITTTVEPETVTIKRKRFYPVGFT